NSTMTAEAGKPDWFKKNYDITVLPAADGKTRLEGSHGVPATLTKDVTDFSPPELNFIEFALQTMTDLLVGMLNGVRLVRKALGFFKDDPKKPYKEDPSLAGLAQETSAGDKTISIFNKATAGDALLFVGGKGGIRQEATMTAAHEFGHI